MFHLFKRHPTAYKTPAGKFYGLFRDMAERPHLLIAGATGSGKSVLINGIMTTLLYQSPACARFILIDPKRVELAKYKSLPHTILHAGPDDMAHALREAVRLMDERFQSMEKRGLTMYDGPALYVIVDAPDRQKDVSAPDPAFDAAWTGGPRPCHSGDAESNGRRNSGPYPRKF